MTTLRDDLVRHRDAAIEHPGLWLDSYIMDCGENEEAGDKQEHLSALAGRRMPSPLKKAYGDAFKRRFDYALTPSFAGGVEGGITKQWQARFEGRLVTGLGSGSILETGLLLNHTYGLPYLPGTALKGLASATARQGLEGDEWALRFDDENGKLIHQGECHRILFGRDTDGEGDAEAGIVVFHDAWWEPEATLPFDLDVMTPHHPKTYSLKGDDWPYEWDGPNPIAFLTVKGTFRVALSGPPEWVEVAGQILEIGLKHFGFGGKTEIGYGRGELNVFTHPVVPQLTTDPQALLFRIPAGAGYQPDQPGAYGVRVAGAVLLQATKNQVNAFLPTPTNRQRDKINSAAGLLVKCTYMPGEHSPRTLELPTS